MTAAVAIHPGMLRKALFIAGGVVLLVVLLIMVTGCAPSEYTTPPVGPGTAYPCGYTGVICYDTTPATCCPMNHLCKVDDAPYCENTAFDPSDPVNMGARSKRVARTALLRH